MNSRFSAATSILGLAIAALASAPVAAQIAPAAGQPQQRPPAGDRGQTVTVTGSRPQVIDAPDRLSFNVANDLGAQTASLAEALRNVPGVEVDLEGKLSLRGDPGVKILIDGRPSGQLNGDGRGDALLAMPANQIERVEVITNPSAANSPEGSGGIINLITRKQRQAGTTGTVRANAGLEGRGSVALSVARSRPGLTVSGDASYRRFTNQIIVTQDRERFVTGGPSLLSRQEQFHDNVAQGGNGRFGVDYDLDKTNRLSGEISYRRNQLNSDRDERFIGNAVEPGFTRRNEQEMRQRILSLRGSWRKTLPGKDHSFSFDVQHDSGGMNRELDGRITPAAGALVNERIANDIDRNETRIKADYKKPLGEGRSLNLGYEFEGSNADFDSFGARGTALNALVPQASLTNRFDFSQDVHAFYATAQVNKGKWEFLPGIRLEQVGVDLNQRTDGSTASQDYFRVYPTLHVGRQVSDRTKIRASYSRRIQRPGPFELNPYTFYVDARNLQRGNPNLKPEVTDAFETSIQYRKDATFLSLTGFYRRSRDMFTEVLQTLPDGVLLTTRANLGRGSRLGVDAILNGRLSKTLNYQLSGTVQRMELDPRGIAGTSGKVSDVVASARGSINFQPSPKDFLQVSGNWQGKQLIPQGYRLGGAILNVGYRRKIDDKLSLLVTGQNILDSARQDVVVRTPAFRDRLEFKVRGRAVLFGFAYSFGQGGNKKPQPQGFDFDPSAGSVSQ
ncbi:TonB-dependent receptor domain-containing protein [Sphingomonas humi]|uniref:TonB-dependent receptor n=1 Tax=Sphingomonas humi TaxID=335630 RepID=A0ABP7REA5_9SPHN